MSFMTFVLSSPDNILTPEIAFVSLSLFNLIRMPMTSIILFFSLFLLTLVIKIFLKLLISLLFLVLPILIVQFVQVRLITFFLQLSTWVLLFDFVGLSACVFCHVCRLFL